MQTLVVTMSAFEILRTVLSLIPALVDAIKAIEEAIPGQGKGEQKLAAIRQIIEATYDRATDLWPYVERTITTLVGLFNATGVFRK